MDMVIIGKLRYTNALRKSLIKSFLSCKYNAEIPKQTGPLNTNAILVLKLES